MPDRRKWILCVDDDETAVLVRKLVLEKNGYAVATANDADAALTMLSAVRFDLVMTDHFLNGTLGTQLAEAIKRTRPTLPVVLHSGAVETPDGLEHVDLVLPKCEPPEVLVKELAILLEGKSPSANAAPKPLHKTARAR